MHAAGNPKGVLLTHTNVLSTVLAMQTYCQESKLDYSHNDNVLSYLTMAHILGRVVEEFALSCGASIGYWQVQSCLAEGKHNGNVGTPVLAPDETRFSA